MKRFYLNMTLVLMLFVAVFITSCRKEKTMIKTTISLAGLQKIQLDTFFAHKGTLLWILEKHPSHKESNAKEKYSNFYVCNKTSNDNNDTIYVFEECHKVDLSMYDDTISCLGIIDKYNITNFSPNEVIVFVPNNFKFNPKIKYVEANLKILSEY